ncbi:MAG TPA: spore germination protein [Bacillota bacterium]|nr:spore germination protein [Bacillota bacterium]
MDLPKPLQKLFTFQEPQPEPEFVLAWDEPEELKGTKQKQEEFLDEEHIFRPGSGLSGALAQDLQTIRAVFGAHETMMDERRLKIAGKEIAVLFLPYVADRQMVGRDIVAKLGQSPDSSPEALYAVLSAAAVQFCADLNFGFEQLLQGQTLILTQGQKQFIIADSKSSPHRQVEKPITERVLKGAQEGFIEDLDVNLALIQKRLRTHRLTIEKMELGTLSRTECAVLSLKGIVNPRLLKEVHRRMKGIKIDFMMDSGVLEQLIEDNTFFPYPQVSTLERPDRVAAGLTEGKVAILVDGSPLVILLPTSAANFIHTAEDYSVRWPYGIYMRFVRITALFMILFLPALYVAVNTYQPELLPTDLLFSLISIKLRSPIPTIIEVFFLEFLYEVLREASIRSPQYLASPIIITAGIFLGLVSVITHIINPILLIVVIVTAISAFTIPDFSTSLSFRLIRYLYIILAFMFGLIGIVFGIFIHLYLLVSQKSFGVPMLAPIAPFTKRSRDIILMRPTLQRQKRPDQLDPLQVRRQPETSQMWKDDQQKPGHAPETPKERDEEPEG